MASRELPPGGLEIERDVEIARDVTTVFAFLTDPTKLGVVDDALIDAEPMTPMARGTAGRMTHRRGGMIARTTWAVTAFDPPRALTVAFVGSGYAMTESAEPQATRRGTRIRFVDSVWPTSLMRRDPGARSERLAAALT